MIESVGGWPIAEKVNYRGGKRRAESQESNEVTHPILEESETHRNNVTPKSQQKDMDIHQNSVIDTYTWRENMDKWEVGFGVYKEQTYRDSYSNVRYSKPAY